MNGLRCGLCGLCAACAAAAYAPGRLVHGISPKVNETTEAPASDNAFTVERSTQGGGGVLRAVGGDFELSGTVGQFGTGRMEGNEFELTGGFWFELVSGDCNQDGSVSGTDTIGLIDCLNGPAAQGTNACGCGDLDGDGHIDLRDFAAFQNSFVGP